VTNGDGIVEFATIYPGAYGGRTPHIHAKVHVDRRTALTTQLYFDDDVTARVHARDPYSPGEVTNDGDGIFDERMLLKLSRDGDGYLGLISFDIERA
jgi:protocatechuate 3,4-dioxygenase beta subunit